MTLEEQMRLEQEKAFAEGKNQGKSEERTENARKMKREGIEISMIAKITGLAVEEIEKL